MTVAFNVDHPLPIVKDPSPSIANDKVACAESVNEVNFAAFRENIGGGLSNLPIRCFLH